MLGDFFAANGEKSEAFEEGSRSGGEKNDFGDAIAAGLLQRFPDQAAAESLAAGGRFESHGAQQGALAVALEGGAADDLSVAAEHQEIIVAVEAVERERGFGEKLRDARVVGGFGAADGHGFGHVGFDVAMIPKAKSEEPTLKKTPFEAQGEKDTRKSNCRSLAHLC